MTVSRVVNQSGYVHRETRERVEAAIAALGYLPNQHARGLRSRRSGTIALIVTDITNPFFTTIARGVEDTVSAAGQMVLLGNTDEVEEEEYRYMKMLVQKGVDGVIFVPARRGEAALELARSNGVPVVILDRRSDASDVDVVRCDSWGGAFELGRLLCQNGHRRFTVLAGPTGISTSDDRVEGFSRAVEEFSPGAKLSVRYGRFSVRDGAALMGQALDEALPPTAVFAVNNFLAIGALTEARERRVGVPGDVALVGFDDLPSQLVTFPFLTVSAQPAYAMGVEAGTRLLRRIEDPSLPCEKIVLPTRMVVRESSGSARLPISVKATSAV